MMLKLLFCQFEERFHYYREKGKEICKPWSKKLLKNF